VPRTVRPLLVVAVAASLLVAFASSASAAPGVLDTTFGGGDGIVTTPIGTVDQAFATAIDGVGRIVVAGSAFATATKKDFAVARYLPDGSLDSAFGGGDGVVTTNFATGSVDDAFDVALDSAGRILVAGSSTTGLQTDVALARYLGDGTPDATFDGDGRITTDVAGGADAGNALAITSEDDVVVAGSAFTGATSDFAVLRYTSAGALDATFDGDGVTTTDFMGGNDAAAGVAIDASGRYVVGGSGVNGTNKDDFALARYDATGALDPSFDGDGKLITTGNDQARDVAIDAAGRIVLGGTAFTGSTLDFALVRFNPNGTPDSTFGSHGRITTPVGTGSDGVEAVAIDANGTIVAAGSATSGSDRDVALARYGPSGQLLGIFGGAGTVDTNIGPTDSGRDVAIDASGNIVVAGYATTGANADFAVLRYIGNGFRTDAVIRRPGDFTSAGDDVYNASATGQVRTAKGKLGSTVGFTYSVQNEGIAPDAFTVAGCGDSAGFTVDYAAGATDVTADVEAGTYVLGSVGVGSASTLQVSITVAPGATAGTVKTCKISAASQGDATSIDAVKAKVKAIA
jgi:uncharacterized delta-60 repeat protein